jgi:hypothetical protein
MTATSYSWPAAAARFGLTEPGRTHVPQGHDYDFTINDDVGAELMLSTIRDLYPHTQSLGN